MRAMSLNGMDFCAPRLMKHCRSGALAANRCYRHEQVRCEGAAPTAHPALFHVKRHGLVPAPNDETRGSLDAAKRNPGTRQSASLLPGYETASRLPLQTLQQQAGNRGLSPISLYVPYFPIAAALVDFGRFMLV
jgi:hypothetical protein